MPTLPSLRALGPRICVLGQSNSGKSTLSLALARRTGLPVIHLDQLHHLHNTDWRPRDTQEFMQLHRQAIAGECWIIEGNYRRCLPERLERATGVILLDVNLSTSLYRYLRRCTSPRPRPGGVEGASDRISLSMLRYITFETPAKRKNTRALFDDIELPKALLNTQQRTEDAYRYWGISPSF